MSSALIQAVEERLAFTDADDALTSCWVSVLHNSTTTQHGIQVAHCVHALILLFWKALYSSTLTCTIMTAALNFCDNDMNVFINGYTNLENGLSISKENDTMPNSTVRVVMHFSRQIVSMQFLANVETAERTIQSKYFGADSK